MPDSISHPPPPEDSPPPTTWLVRIDEIFVNMAPEILEQFGSLHATRLGHEYYVIKTHIPEAVRGADAATFARWNMPIQHSWPCNPQRMTGFIEKAAQAIFKKFGSRNPQTLLMGALNPTAADHYYKSMASNLRGRTLQLFPHLPVGAVEEQNPEAETLFCLIGREGLFCGMSTPKQANGFYPGGSRFVSLSTPATISRAGGKIAEALHYLLLYRPPMAESSHWIELGACPGGMTSELLARGFRVTALDRAPLDQRLHGHPELNFILSDAAAFEPASGVTYDALLCDMNGPPHEAMQEVVRLGQHLRRGGLVVFTMKFSRTNSIHDALTLLRTIVQEASAGGLRRFAQTHLTYNGHEFSLFFERV